LERHGVDSATASIAAALAEGSLETYTPANCATMLANRHTAYTLLQEVVQSKGVSIFNQARQLAGKRAQCEALLHWLTLLCRDLVMLHVAPSVPLYNHDLRSELFILTQRLSVERLLDTYTLIEKLRQYLTMNINSQLIFEHLLVYFQQILASAALSGIRRDASFT
jgi:DNA polymerase III gamma/tau subunit